MCVTWNSLLLNSALEVSSKRCFRYNMRFRNSNITINITLLPPPHVGKSCYCNRYIVRMHKPKTTIIAANAHQRPRENNGRSPQELAGQHQSAAQGHPLPSMRAERETGAMLLWRPQSYGILFFALSFPQSQSRNLFSGVPTQSQCGQTSFNIVQKQAELGTMRRREKAAGPPACLGTPSHRVESHQKSCQLYAPSSLPSLCPSCSPRWAHEVDASLRAAEVWSQKFDP